jgi:transcriptional regulator with XRE-family HTH domain
MKIGGYLHGVLRIKELRLAHDPPLSQEKLARQADISFKTVARAERTGRASSATLVKLAGALGCGVRDLFGEAA